MTKVHNYKGQGSIGMPWYLLDPVLTEELKRRSVINPNEFICTQNIEIDQANTGILFEYDVHVETEVNEE